MRFVYLPKNFSAHTAGWMFTFASGLISFLLFFDAPVFAFNSYFDTELSIELCPEYAYGGVTINVFYRIANSPEAIPAQIISSNIDQNDHLYKPVVRLPATMQYLPFHIFSTCTSTLGSSAESDKLIISNCDKLALYDSDFDGLNNLQEDRNCDNFFSPGDYSNPDNADSDGDGVADLVEYYSATDPTNQGSSPRPYIVSSSPFDPDADGRSNPVVWRPSNGTWYIKNPTSSSAVSFGTQGDIPFTYSDVNKETNIGLVRRSGTKLSWYFRGRGFDINSVPKTAIEFGIFGDVVVIGAWEKVGVTNPAVARLVNNVWEINILLSDGQVRQIFWGSKGDLLKPQDFDGDGLLDVSIYRPSTQLTYLKQSSDNSIKSYAFGTGTSDYTVKGDFTADGKEEVSFWEPATGIFTSLTTNNGINPSQGAVKNPNFYKELKLGEFFNDLPLSWNFDGSKNLYTIINHSFGVRKFYPNNDKNQPIQSIQWGLSGDFQG